MEGQYKMSNDYSMSLLKNVHKDLPLPEPGETFLVRGDYEYWHYGCDGFNDKGWGCGYRTLQTICSWIKDTLTSNAPVPNLRSIQEILVALEDKDKSFIGSREWIGSFEVCLVLDYRYDVVSKIIHIPNGKDLIQYIDKLKKHFEDFASPIMMGGDKDCSSKGIMGIHIGSNGNAYLLVVDPHFIGKAKGINHLQSEHWIKWQHFSDFVNSSFYNFCLPQVQARKQHEGHSTTG
ncbi:ufm1-specific protease 1 isoform X2 [Cephus cinctus]|uniref:Ufm1-specific protease 1 isoform X2 n=1 Tax=Cephus cinctus TaxID=211228 RepID=A0AAJ7RSR1_CEPCN|nr:ufm1-specific protease 1 isoform X2 [Cephus cinctus]